MSEKNEIDCRAVSNELMYELEKGGFKEFVEFVRKTEKENLGYRLVLCFRGNSSPSNVVIYYHNHMVWKLNKSQGKKLKVTISFNHARYTKDWESKLNELYEKYNFSLNKKGKGKLKLKDIVSEIKNGSNGYLTVTSDSFDKNFVEGSFYILKTIIDDFFGKEHEYDYFKGAKGQNRFYLEKMRQHELYLNYNNTNNGLFIYDLEFAQKKNKDIPENDNQPDMVGIRFKNGKPEKLVLIEVKCKKTSMENKSGLEEHTGKMEKYIKNEIAIKNRIEEANKILQQYSILQLRKVQTIKIPENIPIEIRIILTDEAIEYFDKNNYLKLYIEKNYKVERVNDNQVELYK